MIQQLTVKKQRQLNYEILRILAMLMIVCLHYLSKGGLLGDPARADMTATGYAAWLMEALCLVAVNAYVLISGYFGIGEEQQPGISAKAVIKRPYDIWKQVLFYSVIIGLAAFLFGGHKADIYQVFTYIFPIVTEHYWFATSYVILCLLMPFLNAGFAQLDKNGIRYLILGLLVLFSISKTVIPMQLPWDHYGYDAFWFIILYLTGAYIRRFGIAFIKGSLQAVLLYLISELMIFASFLVLRTVFLKTGKLEDLINYGYTYNYLFCYTGAIGLFLAFAGFGDRRGIFPVWERYRKPIEHLSGATFGVYLIHEHITLRSQWPKWFACEAQLDRSVSVFLLHMAGTVLAVYLVCTLIEIVRKKAAEVLFNKQCRKRCGSMIYLLALILLLYPLRHAATGIDLMDAGYALGNYLYFDTMNETWKLATYLANVLGRLFTNLPFGSTWVGMNVYTSLPIGMTAAAVFLFFVRRYGRDTQEHNLFGSVFGCGCLLFAAELVALSLCWAPSVILYHYMGYILMTAASLVLFCAIVKDHTGYYIASGLILGLCVAVRMPNITYMALIVPLWYFCFLKRKTFQTEGGNTWFRRLVNRTLVCMAGYFSGLFIFIIFIGLRYGFHAYPEMITSLFGMTETATDYKPTSMIMAMFGDYIQYSVWLILFLAYMAAGFCVFAFLRLFLYEKYKKIAIVFKILYAAGLLVVLRLCYGRGMFDFDYSAYFSMYKWVTVYLLVVIALCIWCLVCRSVHEELKLWAVFLLVTIMITPLGSNNGLYPIVNNLFLTAPVSLLMLTEAFRQSKAVKDNFVFRTVAVFVFVCTALQSILFGMGFVFHDVLPPGEERVVLSLRSSQRGDGLKTTKAKKEQLEALDKYLFENGLTSNKLILFGDIPALAYLFDMEPAVYTTWADLDSNSLEQLQQDLENLEEEAPVIIFGVTSVNAIDESSVRYRKLLAIQEFMQKRGYSEAYMGEAYAVYCADG